MKLMTLFAGEGVKMKGETRDLKKLNFKDPRDLFGGLLYSVTNMRLNL